MHVRKNLTQKFEEEKKVDDVWEEVQYVLENLEQFDEDTEVKLDNNVENVAANKPTASDMELDDLMYLHENIDQFTLDPTSSQIVLHDRYVFKHGLI